MAGKRGRRNFGYVRKRVYPSGLVRWEPSYIGPDLGRHYCPTGPWSQKMDAELWLDKEFRLIELHNLGERLWTPPKSRTLKPVRLGEYAETWNRERKLGARTRIEYERYRTKHLGSLSKVPVGSITDAAVRSWWSGLDAQYERRNSQVYAWLKSVLATAVTDQLLPANPCNIRGASRATVKHQPMILTVDEVSQLAAAMDPRYRLAILLMAWATVRWGEVSALTRKHLDGMVLRVEKGVTRAGGKFVDDAGTKSRRVRVVAIPPHLAPEVERHLREHVGPSPDALLFPSVRGGSYMDERVFRKSFFDPAAKAIGREGLWPHDLRKFAGTQTAAVGATLAENMARMGHSTVKASLIYQQAVSSRDAEIAVALSKLAGWSAEGES
ncbi:putative prophage phiRv2 integrase [Tsukamurella pulmonis]|nr:putative prophage phiRv2 integrase [Tsukamurella pulmonis]